MIAENTKDAGVASLDIDLHRTWRLATGYYRALATRLCSGEQLSDDVLRQIDVSRTKWLHPRLVAAIRLADSEPALVEAAATTATDDLAASLLAPPELVHVNARNPEAWSTWGVENLASYAATIAADDRISFATRSCGDRTAVVNQAVAVLQEVWPEAAFEFHCLVRVIVHVEGGGFSSASFDELLGAAFVGESYLGSVASALEMILHEGGHHGLFLRERYSPFVTNGSVLAHHPLRTDPRPISGILHAAYVLCRMATGLARWVDRGDAPTEASERAERCASDLRTTVEVLREKAEWTATGASFFGELELRSLQLL